MEQQMLVLFDIDGTLLTRVRSSEEGQAISIKEEAFKRMVQRIWSLDEGFYTHVIGRNLRGMTDIQIILELTGRMGIPKSDVLARMSEVKLVLFGEFDRLASTDDHRLEYEVLPGVRELLVELSSRSVKLGLATGNLEHFAAHKLRPLGPYHFFTIGGFGDDHLERSEIVAGAVRDGDEARSFLVGDTPRDIMAARDCNIGAVAVATGGYSLSELAAHSPGLLVHDLTERDRILEYLGL
jgi:phosphoglycolate phosphatase